VGEGTDQLKEDVMKTGTMVAAGLLLATLGTGASQAQDRNEGAKFFSERSRHSTARLDLARKSYAQCLQSANDGVVESGLAHVVRMKLYVPAGDYDEIRDIINGLAVNGRTPAIRYRAYLAALVFDDPWLFTREAGRDYESGAEMFLALAQRLDETLIGYNDRKYVRPE
jgi:hypothetical protein